MAYQKEEQETVLVFDYSTGEWTAYSTVPKHIRKLMNIGEMNIIESEDDHPIAVQGKLSEKQVSMKKLREYTDEQRQKVAERMRNYQAKKKNQI